MRFAKDLLPVNVRVNFSPRLDYGRILTITCVVQINPTSFPQDQNFCRLIGKVSWGKTATHRAKDTGIKNGKRINGGHEQLTQQFSGGRPARVIPTSSKPTLEPQASAALRDQLTAELKDLNSA